MNAQPTLGPWRHDPVWSLIYAGKEEVAAIHHPNKANARLKRIEVQP